MYSTKKLALVFALLLLIGILLVVFGIETYTVRYHSSLGKIEETKKYTKFIWQKDRTVKLLDNIEDENYLFIGWYYDKAYNEQADSTVILTGDLDLYAGWFEKNPNTGFLLPELYVQADTHISEINRSEYVECTFMLTNTMKDDCFEEIEGRIRGRGNSTWTEFDKKPYKISFDEARDMFHMGTERTWVLLSNAVDYTLMRNEIALSIGNIIGLEYTPECQWIQLFYNEEYLGIYLLCEQIETGINRINIETPYDQTDIDTGFLLELGGGLNGFPLSDVKGTGQVWGESFSCEIRYPESNKMTKNQQEYINTYMQLVNNAILNKNWGEIIELVDIDSFVGWYLVNEIMLNGDMGWSMYAYKPSGDKLFLGPIWDFDQSCGVSSSGGADFETWYPDTNSQNEWFNTLIEMEEFKTLLTKRWNDSYDDIEIFLQKEQEKPLHYMYDINENFKRWDVIGTSSWRIREEIGSLKTYKENVEYLFTWLQNRINWINKELNS